MGEMGRGDRPALQVIVLGAGGGPREDNVTAFLVRSVAAGWRKGSLLAVDAGVHLAAISRILEGHKKSLPRGDSTSAKTVTYIDGPFEGLQIAQNLSDSANAAYITRDLVDCFLITHPHLDHIAGFVVNTASLSSARPKRLAGLPSTIEAFKNHIFNNIIWPNLTDENNGAGLVTYLRLVEGGSPAFGDGYVEVSDGLSVKTWGVSHGHCIERHNHRGSNNTSAGFVPTPNLDASPRTNSTSQSMARSASTSSRGAETDQYSQQYCVYDSSAYFIRDITTNKEILIFGDVEPDTISYSPRNQKVWNDAAPKVMKGTLGAIFIECSYDDSRQTELLFGHLTPYHLVEELKVLASEIRAPLNTSKNGLKGKKRKHEAEAKGSLRPPLVTRRKSPRQGRSSSPSRRDTNEHMSGSDDFPIISERRESSGSQDAINSSPPAHTVTAELPLQGIKVVIFHIKEKFEEPDLGDKILKQLKVHENGLLGCEFIISYTGQSLFF